MIQPLGNVGHAAAEDAGKSLPPTAARAVYGDDLHRVLQHPEQLGLAFAKAGVIPVVAGTYVGDVVVHLMADDAVVQRELPQRGSVWRCEPHMADEICNGHLAGGIAGLDAQRFF